MNNTTNAEPHYIDDSIIKCLYIEDDTIITEIR